MTLSAIRDNLARVPEADIRRAVALVLDAKRKKRTVFFIGNGGSAAIASHMAADFLKNGGMAAQCFNDGALVTCLANDLGFENVFAKSLSTFGQQGDVVFVISSSGESPNILLGVAMARVLNMDIVTLSGFDPDNALRGAGDVNFYVASGEYGVVEVAHHAICHAVLDTVMSDAPFVQVRSMDGEWLRG